MCGPRHGQPRETILAVNDSIARYRAASEANDIDTIMSVLAPDASLISPVSSRMVFRGHDDLRALLTAVYGSLRGLRWHTEVGDDRTRVVIGTCKVGPLRLDDAMVFELAPDGQIETIRPHLRPWLSLTVFALILGAKLAGNVGLVKRALRS